MRGRPSPTRRNRASIVARSPRAGEGRWADRPEFSSPRWSAFGLSLLCAAYLFGHSSGCHNNPAVTAGMWALNRSPTRDVPWYIGGQVVGAALGSVVLWAILETGDNARPPKFARETLFSGAP